MTDPTNTASAAHSTMKTKLMSYRVVEGVPTFTDSQLAQLFEKAKAERLLPLVMYNMSPDMTAATFVRYYKDTGNRLLWLVFYEGKLAGWVWLDDFGNRTARSHFCLFRWVSEAKLTEEVGRDMFRQLFAMRFRGGTTLQVIRGEMPAFNKPALWFLQKLGMKAIGEIPDAAYRSWTGRFYPMIYLYVTKDMLTPDRQNVEPLAALVGPFGRLMHDATADHRH
jgi:hypothetical protein